MLERLLNFAIQIGFVPKVYECIEDAQFEFNTDEWESIPFQIHMITKWYESGTGRLSRIEGTPEIRSRAYSPYLVLLIRVLLSIATISLVISIFKHGLFSKEVIENALFCLLLYFGSFYLVVMMIIFFIIGVMGIFALFSLPFNSNFTRLWFTPKNFYGIGVILNFICLIFSFKIYRNRYHVGQVLIANKLILVKYSISNDAPISKI